MQSIDRSFDSREARFESDREVAVQVMFGYVARVAWVVRAAVSNVTHL